MEALLSDNSLVSVATPLDPVYRDECTRSFANSFGPSGILVNLRTFAGSSEPFVSADRRDPSKNGAALYLRVVKRRVPRPAQDPVAADSTGPSGPTVLGLGVPGGFAREEDKYEETASYSVVGYAAGDVAPAGEVSYVPGEAAGGLPFHVAESAESVVRHAGAEVRSDVEVWKMHEDPPPVSKYAEGLEVLENGVGVDPDPKSWKCGKSGDTTNLWLNLSTGYIGGGRRNWDGSGGSNGALDHYNETGKKYPLVVKLGTIDADVDSIDCFSYAPDEDGPIKIPNLSKFLEKRGIRIASMRKMEKSTAELEVELNASYAFDAITEAGAELRPISGPGYQSLVNLGNSCYINSVLQLLYSGLVPPLSRRYGAGEPDRHPLLTAMKPEHAPEDLLAQTAKVTLALTSGAYASATTPQKEEAPSNPAARVAPRMFRQLVGRGHVDFCTGEMQDAAQYLSHLWERLDAAEMAGKERLEDAAGTDREADFRVSSDTFAYRTEERIVCGVDGKVKYKKGPPETMLSLRLPMEAAAPASRQEDGTDQESKRLKSDAISPEPAPVLPFRACLDAWAAEGSVDDFHWDHLGAAAAARTSSRFCNFPPFLVVQMQRYELGPDWVPRKIEAEVEMPPALDLEGLRAGGPREEEVLVPEPPGTVPALGISVDESIVAMLTDMGFGRNGCLRALRATGGTDAEAATNWIFEHSADTDFNDPLPPEEGGDAAPSTSGGGSVDETAVVSLVESLGMFSVEQVRAALEIFGGAGDRAADWLFSNMDDLDGAIAAQKSMMGNVGGLDNAAPAASAEPDASRTLDDGPGQYDLVGLVSHIGKNTSSGHYVCHLLRPCPDGKGEQWVIYNDEKVAVSENPPIPHGYLYLFRRRNADSNA